MRRALLFLGLAAGLAAGGPAAVAQPGRPVGVPIAQGVPGDSNPPNWLPALPNPDSRVDDPRWRGAVKLTHGGPAVSAPGAEFRAVYKGGFAYLSWVVKQDPMIAPGADRLYVGFSLPEGNATTRATVVAVTIDSLAGTAATGAKRTLAVYSGTAAEIAANGGNWPTRAVPTWATDTAVWIDSINRTWAVAMKVPLADAPFAGKSFPADGVAVNADHTVRMWFQYLNVIGFDPNDGSPLVEPLAYPRPSLLTNPQPAALQVPDIATKWENFHLRQPGADPVLTKEDGVTLDAMAVGVLDGANLVHLIKVPTPPAMGDPPTTANNVFAARPVNNGADPIGAGQLLAKFRIANWGTSITAVTPDTWRPLPITAANAGAIAAGATDTLSATWVASSDDPLVKEFFAGTRMAHQCVLVELSSNGGNLFLVNDSVYRNMDLVQASTFSRQARISVAGLKAVGGKPTRPVYLFVRAANMPPVVGRPVPPPEPWAVPPPKVPGPPSGLAAPPRRRPDPEPQPDRPPPVKLAKGDPPAKKDGPIREDGVIPPPNKGKPDPGKGEDPVPAPDTRPSYTVYAWHETGETLTVDGLTVKLVEAQTAFGYFVGHEGPLYGWRHALTGARKIGPDLYLVAPPVGGSVDIGTTIEAIEHGHDGSPVCCCGGPVVVPRYAPPARRGLLFRRWRN